MDYIAITLGVLLTGLDLKDIDRGVDMGSTPSSFLFTCSWQRFRYHGYISVTTVTSLPPRSQICRHCSDTCQSHLSGRSCGWQGEKARTYCLILLKLQGSMLNNFRQAVTSITPFAGMVTCVVGMCVYMYIYSHCDSVRCELGVRSNVLRKKA